MQGLLEVTHDQIQALSRRSLIDWSGVWRQMRVAAPLLVARAWSRLVRSATADGLGGQLLHPLSLLTVQPTIFTLGDYPRHILVGQSLSLHVLASGQLPATVHLRTWQAGQERQEKMVAGGQGHFRHTFNNLRDPLKFQAIAGSAASDVGEVEVVEAPAVGNFRIRYQYPEYTRLPSKIRGRELATSRPWPGPKCASKWPRINPLPAGNWCSTTTRNCLCIVRQDGLLQATAIITRPGGYRIEVQDDAGLC